MTRTLSVNRERLVQAFFFVSFGFVLYQLFLLTRPFFSGLLGAGILALTFSPFYNWTVKKTGKPTLSAILWTIAVLLLAVIPIVVIVIYIVQEARDLIPAVEKFSIAIKTGEFQTITSRLPHVFQGPTEKVVLKLKDIGINLEPYIIDQIRSIGSTILAAGSVTIKSLVMWMLNGMVLIISLFFCFRDGERFFQWVISLIPMQADYKWTIAKRSYEMFRAVAVGVGVTAIFQGFAAMIGFWIAGVQLPVIFGLLTVIAALLGASFLVTLPVAFSAFAGSSFWGWFLVGWGVLVVGMLDNFLRPYLIGSRARMPFFLILFGIVGGIKAYGLIGIIFGPVLVAMLITFLKIYREEYLQ